MHAVNETPAQLRSVTKRFGSITAVDGVDLDIRRGEVVALLGANGAGKTTCVRMLLGLSRPTTGTARVFGGDPTIAANRVRTGAMQQIAKLPDTLKVREHVELFASYYPSPLSVDAALEIAGLTEVADRLYAKLSGGQKQRVLFALAICGNPDLLILDEPTVGLDLESRRAIWEQIRRYADAGRAVLLTTHHLEEADALSTRVVVIDRGRIVAEGSAAEIKQRAAGRRIRFTTAITLDAIRAIGGVADARRDGHITEILTSDAERVTRELLGRDVTLRDLEISSAGLEEAFLAITKDVKADAKKEVA